MAARPFNILFLCAHNSARSIIAECIVNRVGVGKFRGLQRRQPAARRNPSPSAGPA